MSERRRLRRERRVSRMVIKKIDGLNARRPVTKPVTTTDRPATIGRWTGVGNGIEKNDENPTVTDVKHDQWRGLVSRCRGGGVGGGGGGVTRWRGGAATVANTAVCGLQNAARHRSKWPAAAAALFVDGHQRKRAKFKTVHAQKQTPPRRFLKVVLRCNFGLRTFRFLFVFQLHCGRRASARRSLSSPRKYLTV